MLNFIYVVIVNAVLAASKQCPANCQACNSTGMCVSCKIGYTGEVCKNNCINCLPGTPCDSRTGYCVKNCIEGLSGHWCNITCDSKCKTCHRQMNVDCISCVEGRYGDFCNENCSRGCFNNTCNKIDGKCTYGCSNKYWGNNCIQQCSELCMGNVCNNETGECLNELLFDCFGSNCSTTGKETNHEGFPSTVFIPASFAMAVLIITIVLFVIYKRRKTNQQRETGGIKNSQDSDDIIGLEMETATLEQIPPQQPVSLRLSNTPQTNQYGGIFHSNQDEQYVEVNQNEDVLLPEQSLQSHQYEVIRHSNPDEEYNNANPIDIVAHTGQCEDTFVANIDLAEQMKKHISAEKIANLVNKKTTEDINLKFKKQSLESISTVADTRKMEHVIKDRNNEMVTCESADNINVCFIDGYKQQRAYISFVGPLANYTSICEIWRLIWQTKCSKIVMFCNLLEAQSVTCLRCVPSKGMSGINDIDVTCEKEHTFATYTVQTLKLQLRTEIRKVVNFNYTAWPTNRNPDVEDLVAFRNDVNNTIAEGPTLVYCSFDEGRIGTYVALDMLFKEAAAEGNIDIFRCVRNLREQRASMIQTADQFDYIHRALVCSMTFYTELGDISQREYGSNQYEKFQNDTYDYITPI